MHSYAKNWAGNANGFQRRRAFTLIEMLITVVVTLIVMLALVNFFAWVGDVTRDGRAQIEMAGPLRGAALRLQNDLDMITVPLRPWPSGDSGLGYFEYAEGVGNDNTTTILGDLDDFIMFTAHSVGEPFVGKVNGNLVTSYDAEIVWWVHWFDLNGDGVVDNSERMLRRRVLLIRPDINITALAPFTGTLAAKNLVPFFTNNDISARVDPSTGMMRANSLADLAQRSSRFAHNALVVGGTASSNATFPDEVLSSTLRDLVQTGASEGEDAILSNLLAFDVRAYDPLVEVRSNSTINNIAVIPGDPGWSLTAAADKIGRGAYVDLGYGNSVSIPTATYFSPLPLNPAPNLSKPKKVWTNATYDTWSLFYEQDGITQNDLFGFADPGINGLDDDNKNGVDDVGERETSPPYPYPLRGLQVKIRIYEPDTRQVRQNTVTATFRPE